MTHPTNPTHPVAAEQRRCPLPRQHKPTPLPRILSVQEAASLLSQAPAWLQGPILMSLYAGLRPSEIVELQWKHLDVGHALLLISAARPKQSRRIPMSGPLATLMQQLRTQGSSSSTVFLTEQSHPLTPRMLTAALQHASHNAQLPGLRFLDLRQTFAIWALETEMPLLLVAKMMGILLPTLIARFTLYIGETHRLTSRLDYSQGPNKFHELSTHLMANPSTVDPDLTARCTPAASTAESAD